MTVTSRKKCYSPECSRMIRGGTHCCRPCMRSQGERHALTCTGTVAIGGPPEGGPPERRRG